MRKLIHSDHIYLPRKVGAYASDSTRQCPLTTVVPDISIRSGHWFEKEVVKCADETPIVISIPSREVGAVAPRSTTRKFTTVVCNEV